MKASSSNDAGMERIRAALPRFRPGTAALNAALGVSSPPGYDARVESALMDRLLGPAVPPSGRAPVVGSLGVPGGVLRSAQLRPATALSVSPRSERLGHHYPQPAAAAAVAAAAADGAAAGAGPGAAAAAAAAARAPVASPPPAAPASAVSGAGGGLVGVLAARVNELEAELAAKARDGAARDRELASTRRQLEGALAEARASREAAAAAAVAAAAAQPRAPTPPPPRRDETPPRPASAIIYPAPRSAGSPSPIRVPVSPAAAAGSDAAALRAEAAALRGELAAARRERSDAEAAAAQLGAELREMKAFLAEYGLVWVGKEGNDAPPPPAPAAAEGAIDFAFLNFRLTQLNSMAGEGKSRVVAKNGAHQLVMDAPGGRLPLTLFKDGLMLRRGPFRPYTSASCKAFVQDILDGFFPFELKDRRVAHPWPFPPPAPIHTHTHTHTLTRARVREAPALPPSPPRFAHFASLPPPSHPHPHPQLPPRRRV